MSQFRHRRESAPAIASPSNEHVRYVKALYRATVRQKERLFVVEGVRLLEDALASGSHPELVLVARDQLVRSPRGEALLERIARFRCLDVTESVLDSITDTVAPQGVVAVFRIPIPTESTPLGPIVVVLDRVRDPGNAGTILRSAVASGVTRTVAFVGSVDAYAPKVVRAGMGAHFRLQILDDMTWDQLLPRLGTRPRFLAVPSAGTDYDRVDWTQDAVVIVGGEADGATPEAEALATDRVTIPMAGPSESLNAAMAATVLLFDVARARRSHGVDLAAERATTAAPALAPKARGGYPRLQPRPGGPAIDRTKRPRPTPKPGGAPSNRRENPPGDTRRTKPSAPRPVRGPGKSDSPSPGGPGRPHSRRPESGPSSPRPPRPRL